MNQTKIESGIETVLNVGSGFILAMCIWQFIVAPYFHYEVSIHQNLQMTTLFTVVSVARGYVWRRFFNAGIHKVVHKFVKNILSGR